MSPGGLVVGIPGFHCRGQGSIHNRGTEVVPSHAARPKNKWKLKIRNFNVIGVDFAQRSFSGRLEESLDLSLFTLLKLHIRWP